MKNLINRLWKEEDGQDLIEYALLVTLLALGCTAAISPLATAISKTFNCASTSMS
ncbi:MAG: Flp family type IVb pilin [Terriglobia bacterium]